MIDYNKKYRMNKNIPTYQDKSVSLRQIIFLYMEEATKPGGNRYCVLMSSCNHCPLVPTGCSWNRGKVYSIYKYHYDKLSYVSMLKSVYGELND